MSLKEIEYLGQAQPGTIGERLEGFIDRLLEPLEMEWLGERVAGQEEGEKGRKGEGERGRSAPLTLSPPLPFSASPCLAPPSVTLRVKKLRSAVLPDMVQGDLPEAERARRWGQLADMYLAQQLALYPPDYLTAHPTPERLLETVERYEEDLTDVCRTHYPVRVTVTVGDAIPVNPGRERGGDDPLMVEIEKQLKQMLGIDT